jgi:hypothetical protein
MLVRPSAKTKPLLGFVNSSKLRMFQPLTVPLREALSRCCKLANALTPNRCSALVQLTRVESSGVTLPPSNSTPLSCTALPPKLRVLPGFSSGRNVLKLIVAPMPPEGTAARPVL